MTSSKPTARSKFVELPPATLAEVARRDVATIEQLFRRGRTPDSLDPLYGALDGRLLGFCGALSPFDEPLRRMAAKPWFPWRGKTFINHEEQNGEGANRLWILGERLLFPFDTRIAPSVLDDRPCMVIDYDRAENPWFVRLVRDELRQVRPGLFLGPSFLNAGGSPRLWLYFGVES